VIGNRTALVHSPLWRMPGKWMLTRMARILTQRKIPDLNSGLRIVRREVLLRYIHLCPSGYSFSTTITMAMLSRGYIVDFVPIRAALVEALGTLDEEQRLALELRVVEGLPYTEVASRLACGEVAARQRVSRGLRKLALLLQERGLQPATEVDA